MQTFQIFSITYFLQDNVIKRPVRTSVPIQSNNFVNSCDSSANSRSHFYNTSEFFCVTAISSGEVNYYYGGSPLLPDLRTSFSHTLASSFSVKKRTNVVCLLEKSFLIFKKDFIRNHL